MKKTIVLIAVTCVPCAINAQVWVQSGNDINSNVANMDALRIGASAAGASFHYGSKGILAKSSGSDRTLFEMHSPDGANKVIFQSLSDAYYLLSYQNKPLFLQGTGGNVALGDYPYFNVQTYPSHKLDVQTNTADDGICINQYGSGSSVLHLSNLTTGGQFWSLRSTGANSSQGAGNFSIYQYGATVPDRLFIQGANGNVGIGNTLPSKKLSINVTNAGDGILISKTGSGAAGIHMENNVTGGHPWALYSEDSGDFTIKDEFSNLSPPRIIIKGAGGSIGVNQSSPQYQLDVWNTANTGGINVGGAGSDVSLSLTNNSTGGIRWSLMSTGQGNTQGAGNFSIWDYNANKERFSINSASGNVGIGMTGGSGARLQIKTDNIATGTGLYIDHSYTGQWSYASVVNVKNADTKALVVQKPNINNVNQDVFLVYGDGRTHIGLQSSNSHPGAKLSVDGEVVCKTGLYVTDINDWADYVFDKNYKLPSLKEVEDYYQTHKHLPEIPSEKEVKEKGLGLVEMNTLLLKKVEELTLYVVKQQKEIDELKQKK